MSDDTKSKSKSRSGIKFFKVNKQGGIKPAFPTDAAPTTNATDKLRIDPKINLDDPAVERLEEPIFEKTNAHIEEQLSSLKPKVEHIAGRGKLTESETDILKRYISVKELEVRDLKEQQKQYQTFVRKVSIQYEELTHRSRELTDEVETLRRRNESLNKDNNETKERYENEIKRLHNDLDDKLRKTGDVDEQIELFNRDQRAWKQRIKEELKRIKLKERELENKHELLKRDSQALLDAKDKHVLELKRKNDALELELETFEETLRNHTRTANAIASKKLRLIETLRLAISLLQDIDSSESEEEEDKRAS